MNYNAPPELTPEEQGQWQAAVALDDKNTQAALRRRATERRPVVQPPIEEAKPIGEEAPAPTRARVTEEVRPREELERRSTELEAKGKESEQVGRGLSDFARNLQGDVDALNTRQEALALKRQAIEKAVSDYEMTLRVVGASLEPELYEKMQSRADALNRDIEAYSARVDEWNKDLKRQAIEERSAKITDRGERLERGVVALNVEHASLSRQVGAFNEALGKKAVAEKAHLLKQAQLTARQVKATVAEEARQAEQERPREAQAPEETAAQNALAPYRQGDGYNLTRAVQEGVVSESTLKEAGFASEDIRQAKVASIVLKRLEAYRTTADGAYDLGKAQRDGVSPYLLGRAGFDQKDIEDAGKARKETSSSMGQTLKAVGIGLIPVVGTYVSAKNLSRDWDGLSTSAKVTGITETGISAIADVLIVVGGVGLLVKAARGGAMVTSLSVGTAEAAAKLASTAAKAGRAVPRISVAAGTSAQEVAEVARLARVVSADQKVVRGLSTLEIEAPATARGAHSLSETTRAARTAAPEELSLTLAEKAALPGTLQSKVRSVLLVEQDIAAKEAVAMARTLRAGGITEVTRRAVLPGAVSSLDKTRAIRAIADLNKESVAEATKRVNLIMGGRSKSEVLSGARTLDRALREQGIKVVKETQALGGKARLPKRLPRESEIRMEPPGARAAPSVGSGKPSIYGTGGRGFPGTATKAPPVSAGAGARVISGRGRLVVALTPGYVGVGPTAKPVRPGTVVTPAPRPGQPGGAPGPARTPRVTPGKTPRVEPGVRPAGVPSQAPIGQPRPIRAPQRLPLTRPGAAPMPGPARVPAPTSVPMPSVEPSAAPVPVPVPTPGPLPSPTPAPGTAPSPTLTRTQPATVSAGGIVPFKMGGGRTEAGEFPHVLQWAQGASLVRRDLISGATTYRRNPGDVTKNPWETLSVLSTSPARPRNQRLDLGAVDVLIDGRSLRFVASANAGASVRPRPLFRRSRRGIA